MSFDWIAQVYEQRENSCANRETSAHETPSRTEIESVLDAQVAAILSDAQHSEAISGWMLIPLMNVQIEYLDGDQSIPIPAITVDKSEQLVQMAQKDPLAFDLASHIAGTRFLVDMELPIPLRNFAADVLTFKVKRPSQRGRPPSTNALIEIHQFHLCQYLKHTVPMRIVRDPNTATFTACDAVAEAFCRGGKNTTYEQMVSLCYDEGYSGRREMVKFLGLLDF